MSKINVPAEPLQQCSECNTPIHCKSFGYTNCAYRELASPLPEAAEPVAWQFRDRAAEPWFWINCNRETFEQCSAKPEFYEARPLYATPPAQPVLAPVVREPLAAEMYYLQCSRDYVGNCPMWWREGGNGYTARLDEAGRFTLKKAAQQMRSREGLDVPWLCSEIDALRRPTVDVQDMHKALRDLDVQRAAIERAHGIQATTGEQSHNIAASPAGAEGAGS